MFTAPPKAIPPTTLHTLHSEFDPPMPAADKSLNPSMVMVPPFSVYRPTVPPVPVPPELVPPPPPIAAPTPPDPGASLPVPEQLTAPASGTSRAAADKAMRRRGGVPGRLADRNASGGAMGADSNSPFSTQEGRIFSPRQRHISTNVEMTKGG